MNDNGKQSHLDTDLRKTLTLLIFYSTLLGIAIDVTKPIAFNWHVQHSRLGGLWVWEYSRNNWVFYLLAIIIYSRVSRPSSLFFWIGFSFVLVGPVDLMYETAMIPVVWHPAIGFMVSLTLHSRHEANAIREAWDIADRSLGEQSLEIKKQLMQEMQWSLTTYTTIWLALTAAFGVSITIMFQTTSTDNIDAKWNGIVMALAFGGCLIISCWFGASHALQVLMDLRRRWISMPREPRATSPRSARGGSESNGADNNVPAEDVDEPSPVIDPAAPVRSDPIEQPLKSEVIGCGEEDPETSIDISRNPMNSADPIPYSVGVAQPLEDPASIPNKWSSTVSAGDSEPDPNLTYTASIIVSGLGGDIPNSEDRDGTGIISNIIRWLSVSVLAFILMGHLRRKRLHRQQVKRSRK